MPRDEDLARRIRELTAGEDGVTERRMFGSAAFLAGGHLAVAASGRGGLMVRIDPQEGEALLAEPGVRPFEMRGRELDGWLRVDADAVDTQKRLRPWVQRGLAYARSLPPKG